MVLSLRRIRLSIHKGLILFFSRALWIVVSLIVPACSGQKEKSTTLEILWENERATGVIVPSTFLAEVPRDSIASWLRVYLSGMETPTAILGDYQETEERVIFKPLIPFTPGLTYEIALRGEIIGEIEIPHSDHTKPPEITAVYPSQDTLPENLLKFYIQFSHPMREGQALRYITLLKNGADTVEGTFLDLQPELWNRDYTSLTLWLDPGRIKRDLQPNIELGVPLESAASYTLIVRSGWPDTRGGMVAHTFQKSFYVAKRDSIRPDIKQWSIITPKQNTTDPLMIVLNETLDGVLLKDALQITYPDGTLVNTHIELKEEESVVEFTPELPWRKGPYHLQAEGRLEDLAGNNLNRLFDRDITTDAGGLDQEVYTRRFEIH